MCVIERRSNIYVFSLCLCIERRRPSSFHLCGQQDFTLLLGKGEAFDGCEEYQVFPASEVLTIKRRVGDRRPSFLLVKLFELRLRILYN